MVEAHSLELVLESLRDTVNNFILYLKVLFYLRLRKLKSLEVYMFQN